MRKTVQPPYRRRVAAPKLPPVAPDPDIEEMLKKVQDELMPEHATDIVAINTETGEFAVAESFPEACEAFNARWPTGTMYVCQVDGGPGVRMYFKS